MALKDWKKEKAMYEGHSIDAWVNRKIHEQIYLSPTINGYVFSVSEFPSWVYLQKKTQIFKSASQAFSFAKQYMRSH